MVNVVALRPAPLACDTCAVRHRAVCGALSRSELQRLNDIARFKKLQPGHQILADSEEPEYFANIVSGVVKLTKSFSDGRQQIVGLQFASDFLGRPFRARSPYDAMAVTDVTLCTFDRKRFETLTKEFPALEHRMFEHALDELDASQEWMLVLGRKTAAEKVATLLLLIARRMAVIGCSPDRIKDKSVHLELPLTRSEMGDFLGLTIETVSRQLSRLKSAGVIGLDGGRGLMIPDIARLEEVCGGLNDT
jgi:CRP/FNR family transcriptional regulator